MVVDLQQVREALALLDQVAQDYPELVELGLGSDPARWERLLGELSKRQTVRPRNIGGGGVKKAERKP